MYIYIAFYIVIITSLIFSRQRGQNISFVFISCLFLFLLGFRSSTVGVDTISYVKSWEHPNFLYGNNEIDIGYKLLLQTLRFFSKSNNYFLFVTAMLALLGVLLTIYKTSKHKIDSLVIFATAGTTEIFYLTYFSMIRQSIAISFCLIALYFYFINNRKIISSFFFLISILIHGSCLIILPFIFLLNRFTLNKKYGIIIISISYIIGTFQLFSLSEYFNIISQFLNISNSFIGKYSDYTSSNMAFGLVNNFGFINLYLLPFSLISIYILTTNSKETLNIWYFKLFFIGIILNNLMSDNLMWGRLVMYFIIFSIIVIPNMIRDSNQKYSKIVYCLVILFFLRKTFNAFSYLLNLNAEYNLIVPYKSWLFTN